MDSRLIQKLSAEKLKAMGLPEKGVSYIVETGISPPARKVGRKRRRNLVLDVPLTCIPGVVLQAESLTGEYPFLVNLDRRRDLLAVFDQPITIKVEITNVLGRRTRTTYTADYLAVDEIRACAYEIKPDQVLEENVRNRPQDWTYDESGYHYLPAERYFRSLGIDHAIVPISTISSVRADNLRLLSRVRAVQDTRKYRKTRQIIQHWLSNEMTMRVASILERLGDEDATPVLQLLDAGLIFADLDRVTLSDSKSVWVSIDQERATIAQESSIKLKELFLAAELTANDVIDPRYELEVATRLAIIQGTTSVNRRGNTVSKRTIQRYLKAYKDSGECPKALVPNWSNCGISGSRIGEVHHTYLMACIHAGKRDKYDSTVSACYGEYARSFQQAREELDFFDEFPISRSSFYNYWNEAPLKNEDSYGKGGRRLENAHADSLNPFDKSITATRPFAVAHIDHWKTDLHLVVGYLNGAKITKRAWLTAMVDAFTGEILAIWLSFADPSKKACTMVIRDCVRRHGRLPEMIIVDSGSEFRSAHFFVMLATLGMTRCERPPEDPRFGTEVERVFLDFKVRFAQGLPGFGISIERARAVSAAFKAAKGSTLTLLEAFEALEAFVFGGYNNNPKPGDLSSRVAIREKGLRQFPHSGRKIQWDLKFLIATSIEAPDSCYTLWTGRGIHVHDKWYRSPRLLAYRGYKKDLTVRLEPYADSIIYVCIDGRWLVCGNSEASLQFAMAETSLLCLSAERQDLSALREELSNEMNRCAAEIVNEKLREIAGRRGSNTPTSTATKDSADAGRDPTNYVPFNFDEIEPYENESPS